MFTFPFFFFVLIVLCGASAILGYRSTKPLEKPRIQDLKGSEKQRMIHSIYNKKGIRQARREQAKLKKQISKQPKRNIYMINW